MNQLLYTCPCCGYKTLTETSPGTFEICHLCGWEDDEVQLRDPDYRGGANSESLREAQCDFIEEFKNAPDSLGYEKDEDWSPLPPASIMLSPESTKQIAELIKNKYSEYNLSNILLGCASLGLFISFICGVIGLFSSENRDLLRYSGPVLLGSMAYILLHTFVLESIFDRFALQHCGQNMEKVEIPVSDSKDKNNDNVLFYLCKECGKSEPIGYSGSLDIVTEYLKLQSSHCQDCGFVRQYDGECYRCKLRAEQDVLNKFSSRDDQYKECLCKLDFVDSGDNHIGNGSLGARSSAIG